MTPCKDDEDDDLKKEAKSEAKAAWKDVEKDKELDPVKTEQDEVEAIEDARKKKHEHPVDLTVDVDKKAKTWEIDAVASAGTKKGTSSFGKGWVADEVEGTDLFLAPESSADKNEKVVTAAEATFQKKWDEADGDPLTYMKDVGSAEVSQFEKGRAYKKMVMKTEFRNPDAAASTIEYRVTISPNAQDTGWKPLNAGSGKLADRLKAIGEGKHPSLLKRFETGDWAKAFDIGTRTAQDNVAEAKKIDRLYEVSSRVYLYVPIADGEVPALIAERVHAAGRESSSLDGSFGAAEIVAFCKADSKVGSLQADWQGGASAALELLVQQGHIVEVEGGKYSFDKGHPLPTPGLHTVKETQDVPDSKKRHSHHVPAKGLANAWKTELESIVDSLGGEGSKFFEHIAPYKAAIMKRAAAFGAAHDSTNATMLTAILIHEDTHQGQDESVHAINNEDTSEEIIARMEQGGLAIYKKGSDILAANPQLEHWQDYIGKCYKQVKEGNLKEGVEPGFADQQIAEMEAALSQKDAEVIEAVETAYKTLAQTVSRSIDKAYDLDQAKLAQALSSSSKDGANKDHAPRLTQLKSVHTKESVWLRELAAGFGDQ